MRGNTALFILESGMEGFTPAFFLQLVIAIGSAGAIYGAVRADLKNLMRSVDEDRRLREKHAEDDDKSFHDIRGELSVHHGKISRLEAQHDLADKLASVMTKH